MEMLLGVSMRMAFSGMWRVVVHGSRSNFEDIQAVRESFSVIEIVLLQCSAAETAIEHTM